MAETQAEIIVNYFIYQWGLAYPIVIGVMFIFYVIYLVLLPSI